MFLRYVDGSGIQRVCGGADLKHSQYYPKLFGHGFAQLYAKHEHEVRKEVRQQAPFGCKGTRGLPNIGVK